jgi:protein phosphatase
MVREGNEDSFLVCPDLSRSDWEPQPEPFALSGEGALLAVADGMGGANAGEVASAIATDAVKAFFLDPAAHADRPEGAGETLVDAIFFAHQEIAAHARAHPECRGMGTTLLLVRVLEAKAYFAWSGDSRLYLYREGEGLRILSDDHSLVWELVLEGRLSPDEADTHPQSNIITQSLGAPGYPPKPDMRVEPLRPGDKLLLCSDGLNAMATAQTIESILGQRLPPDVICTELIDEANRNGGYDNTTVILLEVLF